MELWLAGVLWKGSSLWSSLLDLLLEKVAAACAGWPHARADLGSEVGCAELHVGAWPFTILSTP